MTMMDKAVEALQSCSTCDKCQICRKVDDANRIAVDAIIAEMAIVHCHECIYFEPPKETRWGWCRNSRCKTLPNGFCDEGLKRGDPDGAERT